MVMTCCSFRFRGSYGWVLDFFMRRSQELADHGKHIATPTPLLLYADHFLVTKKAITDSAQVPQ